MASKNRAKGDWKDGKTGTDCRTWREKELWMETGR